MGTKIAIFYSFFAFFISGACTTMQGKYCTPNRYSCCGQCICFVSSRRVVMTNYADNSGIDTLIGRYQFRNKAVMIYDLRRPRSKARIETFFTHEKSPKDSVNLHLQPIPIKPEGMKTMFVFKVFNHRKVTLVSMPCIMDDIGDSTLSIMLHKKEFPLTLYLSYSAGQDQEIKITQAKSQKVVFYSEEDIGGLLPTDTLHFSVESDFLHTQYKTNRTRFLIAEQLVKSQ